MTIDVRITAAPTGGLRVIQHIPAIRPCRLEGRNGIGKSAAIKLLSLATGAQPFADDAPAWRSLREHLNDGAEITFTGLSAAREVVLSLTPSAWPELPSSDIADKLGELRVDGEIRAASELAQMLSVHHLAGTEKLVDTLGGRIASYGNALAVVRSRLESLEHARAELGMLADELEFVSPQNVDYDRHALDHHVKERDDARTQSGALRKRFGALQQALSMRALLHDADFQDRAAELSAAIEASSAARERAKELDRAVEAAIEALEAGSKAQRALAAAERRFNAAVRKRNARTTRLNELITEFQLERRLLTEEITLEVIDSVRDQSDRADAERLTVERRHRQSHMSENQRRLHNQLLVMLEDSVRDGLGDFVVVHFRDADVTVSELAQALAEPLPSEDVTSEELTAVQRRSDALANTVALLEEQREYESGLAEIEQNLADLRGNTPVEDELKKALAERMDERDTEERTALELTQRIGQLQAEGVTEEGAAAARRELEHVLKDEGIGEDDLEEASNTVAGELAEQVERLDRAHATLAEIEERQTRRRVARRALDLRIGSEPELGWLRTIQEDSTSNGLGPDAWWQAASDRARDASTNLDLLISEVAALQYAAGSSTRSKYRSAIEARVETDALADFEDPAIREALFEGGTPIMVDLRKGTITWETSSGARREKPLSTFSSGDQALGFIRARLRQLAETPGGDRIVFLDEFGAFLAADRRHPLAELLKGDQLASLSDQVVIVLPLQVDYRAQLGEVTGALKDRYQRRADSIDQQGYFAEVFDE